MMRRLQTPKHDDHRADVHGHLPSCLHTRAMRPTSQPPQEAKRLLPRSCSEFPPALNVRKNELALIERERLRHRNLSGNGDRQDNVVALPGAGNRLR